MPLELKELLARVDQCSTQASELSAQFRKLQGQIREAFSAAQHDPESSLFRARKVLDYIIRDVYDEALKPKRAGTQPLDGLVQALEKEGHIPKKLAQNGKLVLGLGNVAVHDLDNGLSSQDVLNSLSNLIPIMEWYFEHNQTAGVPFVSSSGHPSEHAGVLPPQPQQASPVFKPASKSVGHPSQLLPSPVGAAFASVAIGLLIFGAWRLALRDKRQPDSTGVRR